MHYQDTRRLRNLYNENFLLKVSVKLQGTISILKTSIVDLCCFARLRKVFYIPTNLRAKSCQRGSVGHSIDWNGGNLFEDLAEDRLKWRNKIHATVEPNIVGRKIW